MSRSKKNKKKAHSDDTQPSFVLDTQSEEVPVNVVPEPRTDAASASANGLDLPGHVEIVQEPATDHEKAGDQTANVSDGEYEQLDADTSRYYDAEANDERKRKGVCPVCGEMGHDKKRCPYKQVCFTTNGSVLRAVR